MERKKEIRKLRNLIREALDIPYPISDPPMYGDSDYKKRGGKIIKTAPKTYLSLVPELKIDEESIDNIEYIKSHITSKKEIDPPTLYVDGNNIIGHDGRHRAHAAMQLGINKIPVLIIDKNQKTPPPIEKVNENVGPGPYDVTKMSDIMSDLYNRIFNNEEFYDEYDTEEGEFLYDDEYEKNNTSVDSRDEYIKDKTKDYRRLKRKMHWKDF